VSSPRIRAWTERQARERFALPVSRTLARRVFFGGTLFYLSFLAHGWVIYRDHDPNAPDADAGTPVAQEAPRANEPPLPRGLLEPALDRVLDAEGAKLAPRLEHRADGRPL
jgi:hypothetical protein